jgi:hypothetical protein
MNKIFLLIFTVSITITGSVSAQNTDIVLSGEDNAKYDFYMMQGDYIVHYTTPNKADTMLYDISFKNGNTITSKAELMNKKGGVIFLKDEQCVDSKGNIADCDHLRKRLKRRTENNILNKNKFQAKR